MDDRRSECERRSPGAARARCLYGLCCLLWACSFEDRVEHCASEDQCGPEQECYRGYCIPRDGSEAPDAGGASARPRSTARGGAGGKVGSTSSASTAAGAKGAASGGAGTEVPRAGSGGAASEPSAGAKGPAATSGSGSGTPPQPGQMTGSECKPAPEQCNGADDDCDGMADEDIAVVECFPDAQTGCTKQSDGHWDCQGICASGTQTCVQGKLGECTGYKTPAPETCTPAGMRAADENCNGMSDESCACAPGEIRSCYGGTDGTLNVGKCIAGTQTCADGVLSACTNEVTPGTETCANQGMDDNCDGKTDNIQNLGAQCLIAGAAGPCRTGKFQCEAGKTELTCIPAAAPGQETCNGTDDDCNGKVDDTFDLMADVKHCGACGKACGPDEACCAGSCVNTKKDANNCGACGMKCSSGACNGGKCREPEPPPPPPMDAGMPGGCQPACGAGQACCNGSCVDTTIDLKHCGACGNACAGTRPGCCNGKCVDLVSNANCGQCGRDCSLLTNGGLTCTCTQGGDGSIACTGPVLNVCL